MSIFPCFASMNAISSRYFKCITPFPPPRSDCRMQFVQTVRTSAIQRWWNTTKELTDFIFVSSWDEHDHRTLQFVWNCKIQYPECANGNLEYLVRVRTNFKFFLGSTLPLSECTPQTWSENLRCYQRQLATRKSRCSPENCRNRLSDLH